MPASRIQYTDCKPASWLTKALPGGAQAALPECAVAHRAAQGEHQRGAQHPQHSLQSGQGHPGCKGSQASQPALVPSSPAHKRKHLCWVQAT